MSQYIISAGMTRVLVVDDDSAFRKALSGVLEDNGYAVLEAATGGAGIAKAARALPDLVILDLALPGPQGTDVCLALKQDVATAGIPVLILTGNDQRGLEVVCLDLGADDYLTKPVRSELLLARCRALLRRGPPVNRPTDPRRLGSLSLDYARKLVVVHGREYFNLTPKEFDLLYALAGHSPVPRSREDLYKEV